MYVHTLHPSFSLSTPNQLKRNLCHQSSSKTPLTNRRMWIFSSVLRYGSYLSRKSHFLCPTCFSNLILLIHTPYLPFSGPSHRVSLVPSLSMFYDCLFLRPDQTFPEHSIPSLKPKIKPTTSFSDLLRVHQLPVLNSKFS